MTRPGRKARTPTTLEENLQDALLWPDKVAGRSVVGSRFVLYAVLGRGGMGVVFLAKDLEDGSDVALKALLRQGPQQEYGHVHQRFLREAEITCALSGPGLPEVRGRGDDAEPFLASTYRAGETLQDRLRRQLGPMPLDEIIAAGVQIARILTLVHRERKVHGDIKPSNVLVDDRGIAHLLDFGSACEPDGSHTITRQFGAHASPHYASPEQLDPSRSSEIDGRTDLYSLARTLLHLASGASFTDEPGTHGGAARRVADAVRRRPRSATASTRLLEALGRSHPRLRRVLERSLERDPSRRHSAARELESDLEALRTETRLAPTPGSREAKPRALARDPLSTEPDAAELAVIRHELRPPTLRRVPDLPRGYKLEPATQGDARPALVHVASGLRFVEVEGLGEQSLWLSVTPMTQEQWSRLGLRDPSPNVDDALPVHGITGNEARRAAGLLGGRLPRLDEWRRACRGGRPEPGTHASHLDESSPRWNVPAVPSPAASEPQDRNGLRGLLGNVLEWCELPPQRSGGVPDLVLAGGSAWDSRASCHPDVIWRASDAGSDPLTGVRVALEI